MEPGEANCLPHKKTLSPKQETRLVMVPWEAGVSTPAFASILLDVDVACGQCWDADEGGDQGGGDGAGAVLVEPQFAIAGVVDDAVGGAGGDVVGGREEGGGREWSKGAKNCNRILDTATDSASPASVRPCGKEVNAILAHHKVGNDVGIAGAMRSETYAISARTQGDAVIARSAADQVIARARINGVVAGAGHDEIRLRAASDHVVAAGVGDFVGMRGRTDDGDAVGAGPAAIKSKAL